MAPLRGQAAARGRGRRRVRGGARVRRRTGQRPDTRQAGPVDPGELRVGPAVLVYGRLAVERLHGPGRGVRQRVRRFQRAVPVPAGVAVLSHVGQAIGRRHEMPVEAQELHRTRARGRNRGRQRFRDE